MVDGNDANPMKKISSILILLAAFCFSAFAEPPDHNDVGSNNVVTVVAPAGVPIDSIIIYGGNHAEAQWHQVKVFSCTNNQWMMGNVPKFDEYTGTSSNSITGRYSDYGPKVSPDTNGVAAMPIPVTAITPK